MNIQSTKPISSKPRRLFAALLLAAFAVAVLAGSALAASLVKNGSFEKDSNGDGMPNGWTGSSLTSKDKRVCNQSYAGACSFKIVGDGTSKYIYQLVSLPGGTQGTNFRLTVWAKGGDFIYGTVFIQMIISHTDGDSLDNYYVNIANGTPWTKYTINENATEDFQSVNVVLVSNGDSGRAWFDKVKLVGP
jgi:hypothetical protein